MNIPEEREWEGVAAVHDDAVEAYELFVEIAARAYSAAVEVGDYACDAETAVRLGNVEAELTAITAHDKAKATFIAHSSAADLACENARQYFRVYVEAEKQALAAGLARHTASYYTMWCRE